MGDEPPHRGDAMHIEIAHRLIEQEKGWMVDRGADELHALQHARAEGGDAIQPPRREAELLEELLGAGGIEREAAQILHHRHMLPRGELRIELQIGSHEAEMPRQRVAIDLLPITPPCHRSRCPLGHVRKYLEERRLARAIASGHREDIARAKSERDLREDRAQPEPLRKILDAQFQLRFGHRPVISA
jgi:hypothetical protein